MSAPSARKYMSKRQRPCDFCRARKTACRIEGSLPCRLCALHARQCTFLDAAHPKKRRNPAVADDERTSLHTIGQNDQIDGRDSETSEVGLAPGTNVLSEDHEMDDLPPHQNLSQDRSANITMNQNMVFDQFADDFFGNYQAAVTGLPPDWPFSAWIGEMSPDMARTGSGIEQSPGFDAGNTQLDWNGDLNPQFLGYSGDMDPFLLREYKYDHTGAFKFKHLTIQSVHQGTIPTQFLQSSPIIFAPSRSEMGLTHISLPTSRAELESIVSKDTGRRLIALYREFILSHYPIFSNDTFPDPECTPPYLLAAIYLIAQPFAKYDDVLSIELAYETLNSQALFRLITEALQYEAHNPSLELVQTLLLVIVRPSANPVILESALKWSLHGTLVATAQSLGLSHNPISWRIASWQISLRRRLSCIIFSVDKWLACSFGRPPLIIEDNWLVTTLTAEDGHLSALTPQVWSQYMHFSQLGALLGEVLSQLFSQRAIVRLSSDFESTLKVSKDLLEKLSAWQGQFFQQTSMYEEEGESLKSASTLGHLYVKMTVFRAVMRPTLTDTVAPSVNIEDTLDPWHDFVRFARTGVESATTAATTFIKTLTQEHFQAFWPHWCQVAFSSICFLSLMMATSSSNAEEAMSWFKELHNTRKVMRRNANILPPLRLGLLRIDAIFWKRIDRVLRLRPDLLEAFKASQNENAG